MTEEIKVQPTAGEQAVAVPSIPQGHTGSALGGAERNDRTPTDAWTALLELLGSKKIPPLDGVRDNRLASANGPDIPNRANPAVFLSHEIAP